MQITWVNHASFIFEYDGIKLICDPWIESTAFDNGWALLAKSVLEYKEFFTITHIWFSHEHPDHFSPPSLNKIPKEYREKITVLFQKTTDKKVLEYCKKAGFGKVIEMKTDKFLPLSKNVECLCNPFSDGDSWLYIKTDKYNLLNINDCIVNNVASANRIKDKIESVDVLFTQFGYANKIGNSDETEKRILASKDKLKRIEIQNNIFKPKVIVPFASYVYFCHEENRYMNNGINKVDTIYEFITHDLKQRSVVLYPGEKWEVLSEHDSKSSINKYLADYARVENDDSLYIKNSNEIKIEDLITESQHFKNKLLADKRNVVYKLFPSVKIWVSDYNKAYKFNLRAGLKEAAIKMNDCDISLSSEALWYSFKHLWGGDTLTINARFQTLPNGDFKRARFYYRLGLLANRAERSSLKSILVQTIKMSPLYKLVSKGKDN